MNRFDTASSATSNGSRGNDGGDAAAGVTTRRIIFTGPSNPSARADLKLYLSTDEAQTWTPSPGLIWSGPAAYSNVVQLNATHAGVIFECGEKEFAQRISFAVIGVGDLPA